MTAITPAGVRGGRWTWIVWAREAWPEMLVSVQRECNCKRVSDSSLVAGLRGAANRDTTSW